MMQEMDIDESASDLLISQSRRRSSGSGINPHPPPLDQRNNVMGKALRLEFIQMVLKSKFCQALIRIVMQICEIYEYSRDSIKIYLASRHQWALRRIQAPFPLPTLIEQLLPDINTIELLSVVALCVAMMYLGSHHRYGTATAMIVGLFTATVPRFSPVTVLLGVTLQDCVKYHRWFGTLMVFVMLLHGALTGLITKCTEQNPRSCFLGGRSNKSGAAIVLIYALLWIGTLEIVRRRLYEVFYVSHIVFATAFYVGIVYHKDECFNYIAVGLFLYLADRIRRWLRSRVLCHITEVRATPGSDAVRVFIVADSLPHHGPGEYAYVHLPTVSRVQWHPLSLTSGPGKLDYGSGTKIGQTTGSIEFCARMSLTRTPRNRFEVQEEGAVKQHDESCWSSGMTRLLQGSPVYVDGPYGHLGIPLKRCNRLVLIGGGVGITPLITFVRHFVYCKRAGEIFAPHTGIAQSPERTSLSAEGPVKAQLDDPDSESDEEAEGDGFDFLPQHDNDSGRSSVLGAAACVGASECSVRNIQAVDLLWVVRERECLDWFQDDLKEMVQDSRASASREEKTVTRDAELYSRKLSVNLYVTGDHEHSDQSNNEDGLSEAGFNIHSERPSIRAELQKIAADEINNGIGSLTTSIVGLVVCGPMSMVDEVRQVALSHRWEGGRVVFLVHQESFLL